MSGPAYSSVNTNESLAGINRDILKHWQDSGIIKEVLEQNPKGPVFTFLEGPPTANGRPHVGHAMTITMKDIFLRYKTMKGFSVRRRTGGWDCHGLPVELQAEKSFGIKSKKDIESIGIEKFNAYCRDSVFTYIDEWSIVQSSLGYSVDQKASYVTLKRDYMESEWWALKTFFDRHLLEKDFKIVPYCPRCGTPLASHEVAQGYKETKDPSVYVEFKAVDRPNRYYLVWTTTPWTLPSNMFLAVNPDFTYVVVEKANREYVVLKEKAGSLFGYDSKIIGELKGSDLVGKEYFQLIPILPLPGRTLKIVSATFVGLEEGTGIVHIAPAFGADDFDVGKREDVEIVNPVDQTGLFSSEKLPWYGMFVKDADPEIILYLKKNGLLFRSEKIEHTYPFCYRCHTPLLYYPLETWFIRVSRFRDLLVNNNEKINWVPDSLREGRFGNFLREAKDWSLSRNRYWGTPLPVWRCKNDHYRAIGSAKEIETETNRKLEDLHRPFIDRVTLKCRECGSDMVREPYVIDTWFDSGSATYAAMHYPFEGSFNPDEGLPVDFISEAIDQTRGWYYVLHVISSLLFGKPAYSNVLTIDMILDERGRKMSKSLGNTVLARELIDEFGGDAVRLFFLVGVPWKTRNIDRKFITEISRRTLYTLLNVYSFFASNANLDRFKYNALGPLSNNLDRWIVSRANTVVDKVTQYLDSYMPHLAFKEIEGFVDELSNVYLRLSRERFWDSNYNKEKKEAYSSLYFVLDMILRMMAPMTPFFADFLYLKLHPGSRSVHLEKFPAVDKGRIDGKLEEEMRKAYAVMECVRRARQAAKIKGRQPVAMILIHSQTPIDESTLAAIGSELNSVEVRVITKDQRPVRPKVIVSREVAAPALKSRFPEFLQYVEKTDPAEIAAAMHSGKPLKFNDVDLPPDSVTLAETTLTEYSSASEPRAGVEVFVDTRLDSSLLSIGLSREVIRRIQVLRKELDLKYDQKIVVNYGGSESIIDAIGRHMELIKTETLAEELRDVKTPGQKEMDIDGETLKIEVLALQSSGDNGS